MTKKKAVRYLLITLSVILGILVFLSITGTVAHAAGLVDNTVSDANQYSKYPLENYQLDFYVDSSWDWLPWNWLDGIGKSIQYGLYAVTNFIWTVSLYISNATGYVVQEAYKLDFISDTATSIGRNIQTLAGVTSSGFSSEGFYVGFLLILILVMGIYVAYTGLIKRETTKAVHAVINFLVVFLLSASFIAYAPNYITKINDFSADVSNAALSLGTKIVLPESDSKGKDSVDLIRDSLFSIQVQQPWLLLQYDESDMDTLGADRVENLLSASPDTDDRQDVVISEIEDNDNANLTVTKTMSRLGTVVFLFIFNIGISVFVFLLTGMMIFSQVLFIIYAMFLPISFVLSMIPTYEGMAKKALMKLFNTIMVRAGIYFKLGDLMAMFSLQSNDTQQMSRQIMRRPYMFLHRGTRRLERKIGRTLAAGAAGGVVGAVAVASTRKTDTTKTGSRARPTYDSSSSSFGQRAGAKVGAALDTADRIKDKAHLVKQQVKDMPIQAEYALHNGVHQIQENVSDFKRGIVTEKSTRKQGRADRENQHRQTIAEKRMELDRAKQAAGSVTKGTAPVHERPVTTPVPAKADPQAAASNTQAVVSHPPVPNIKEQARPVKESPVQKTEQVKIQNVRQNAAPVSNVTQQTTQHQKQMIQTTQNRQRKTVKKSNVKKGNRK